MSSVERGSFFFFNQGGGSAHFIERPINLFGMCVCVCEREREREKGGGGGGGDPI